MRSGYEDNTCPLCQKCHGLNGANSITYSQAEDLKNSKMAMMA